MAEQTKARKAEELKQLGLWSVDDLTHLPDDELLQLRAAVEVQMRARGLALTVGAVGEKLVIDLFNVTPGCPNLLAAPTGTANIDAISRKGERYSIKTVCKGKKTGTVYPDADAPDKQLFEFILVVKLNDDWTLDRVYEFDWDGFIANRSWDKRMNAWYLPASARVLARAKEYGPAPV
ncbi:hypothetical protein M3P21_11310 [Ruegeria sp. 2012CJ41-6]|uniref:Uncharacterized protein n=1 Tax=Ruegeria spongiae TaxID=2942209 RepID=A0ABT0Q3V4_9RHOB|nr:hypothetical protein [Ruegeria spongiae]MCL6284117.1 hypothetical protein [Ruegeria spongiae]